MAPNMLTTGAPPNILIRANIYNNDPIRYIVLVVSCFVLPIPNIYRDTSVLIPVLSPVKSKEKKREREREREREGRKDQKIEVSAPM